MRRIRKIKHLKFNKLLRARTLKLNYILSKRTLRKNTTKKREINYGLLKIGNKVTTYFSNFLKPSICFSYFYLNNITINIFPSLSIPKSTDSTPKYNFESDGLTPILDHTLKNTIPSLVLYNTPGLKLLLFTNTTKSLLIKSSLEVKGLFYQYNYILTVAMLEYYTHKHFSLYYKKIYTTKLLKKKNLLTVCFYC